LDLATIDLSSASDTISKELVWLLLPESWAQALDIARTGDVTLPDGNSIELAKFSSMGNGFTFELESLIFYALARAVCELDGEDTRNLSVFGDDIIVPTGATETLTRVFQLLGFTVNTGKTFSQGPFRESCGADYLFGYSIRPFYQRDLVSDRTLFSMHNFFIRNGENDLAAVAEKLCNPSTRIYGPDGYGDGHLIGSYVVSRSRDVKRRGWDGAYFETYVTRPKLMSTKALCGDHALPTYSVYIRSGEEGPTSPYTVRGHAGYVKRRIYTFYRGIFR